MKKIRVLKIRFLPVLGLILGFGMLYSILFLWVIPVESNKLKMMLISFGMIISIPSTILIDKENFYYKVTYEVFDNVKELKLKRKFLRYYESIYYNMIIRSNSCSSSLELLQECSKARVDTGICNLHRARGKNIHKQYFLYDSAFRLIEVIHRELMTKQYYSSYPASIFHHDGSKALSNMKASLKFRHSLLKEARETADLTLRYSLFKFNFIWK